MPKARRFNAFSGVFTPSVLTILGVIMYLRLPWIVGQAGLLATLGIILVAHIISITTGLSVASIATDKRVETGGPYYMISRSLGLPIGGTLGWALFTGLSFSVSLYLIGFAEVLLEYFELEKTLTTIRITGSIALLVVTILTFISTSLAIRTQFIILSVIALSLVSVFFGNHDFLPLASQWDSLPESLPWITLFAIFFPAVTGFTAGVAMSGDLKDPRKAIPIGTISAILVGLAVYVGLAVFLSYNVENRLLVGDPKVLFKISWIPQLVVAGILGATLSSALGSTLGAPRILQAIAKDHIAPSFFSKSFGKSNEPRNALLLTFFIALSGILIGELNVIARIVTIFFIIIYGFLNITYTVENWASSDFRPAFKIPPIISIIGALACIIVMIQLDFLALTAASLVLVSLFFYLKKKELNLQTGDTRSSLWLSLVKTGLIKLTKTQTSSRNWRPNVILFSGGARNRPHLIETGTALVGKLGVFTNFELIEQPDKNLLFEKKAKVSRETYGKFTNIITRRHICSNIYEGIEMISRVYGFSGFEPNTILMGWAKNTRDPLKLQTLLVNLNKLDYNLTFLNYDKDKGFGNYKRIDFWWSGKGKNLAFALHLIRFITVTPEWRRSEVRLFAVNPDSKNTDRYYSILTQVTDNYRISTQIKVINNTDGLPLHEIISPESQETDLTIVEFPDINSNNIAEAVNYVNILTDNIKTCLIINAYSGFEEVNILPDFTTMKEKPESSELANEKPDASIISNIQFSKVDIVFNEVYNLAQVIEKSNIKFFENVLFNLTDNFDNYLEQLSKLSIHTFDRLKKADSLKTHDKHWEYLKILNDYSFHTKKQLESYSDSLLQRERDLLADGYNNYMLDTGNAVELLPRFLRLKFGKKDFAKIRAKNLISRLNKSVKLLRLTIFGKELSYKIKIHPAARYYLYYKRLDYFRQFFESHTLQSLKTLQSIKDVLDSNFEVIGKAFKGNSSHQELIGYEKATLDNIKSIENSIKNFVNGQGYIFINEIIADLESFSRIIESPQANLLSRKFKSYEKDIIQLEQSTKDYADLWLQFMIRNLNRALLDYIYLSLKNRLAAKIEKTYQDLEVEIEGKIYSKIKTFEKQIISLSKGDYNENQSSGFLSPKSLNPIDLEDIFTDLLKEIALAVDDLPESIEITEVIPEIVTTPEGLDKDNAVVVAVRKTADFYISNELRDQISKQSDYFSKKLNMSVSSLKDMIKLASFHLENGTSSGSNDDENENTNHDNSELIQNILNNLQNEEKNLREQSIQIKEKLFKGLEKSFDPLSSANIIKTSSSLKKKSREAGKDRITGRLYNLRKNIEDIISDQLVALLYRQSKGILWADRLDKSYKDTEYQSELSLSNLPGKLTPIKLVLQNLPFYYSNLFSGSSNIGEDFWVGMESEVEKGSIAIKRFTSGAKGLLIVSGDRSSGKSSLCKYLARLHFQKENIINIRAPRESCSNIELFDQTLLSALKGQNELIYHLNQLPPGSVILINDLELWWERKPFGTQVIERIITLMQENSNRILFIVNINKHALNILNKLTSINTWAIDILFCQAFDARELKDLILTRHQAGGMKFVMNGKHESNMTKWDYARLFNRFFKLSFGNPGYAINLWLAGIRKISGNTLYMESPPDNNVLLQKNIPSDEVLIILQFILHRRFSVRSLSEILKYDYETTDKTLRVLLQKGIVIEKFPEVFSLNPALEIHLVKKLKSLELL